MSVAGRRFVVRMSCQNSRLVAAETSSRRNERILTKTHFTLRFRSSEIGAFADAYEYGQSDVEIRKLAVRPRERGYYTKAEFLRVCYWKSRRTQPLCASNAARHVEVITRAALTSALERVRIETVLTLRGVSWPTASVLLHFGHADEYPILDYRALWSLGYDKPPPYTFEFWAQYVSFCRALAKRSGVSVRTLDRALWQYSKAHQ